MSWEKRLFTPLPIPLRLVWLTSVDSEDQDQFRVSTKIKFRPISWDRAKLLKYESEQLQSCSSLWVFYFCTIAFIWWQTLMSHIWCLKCKWQRKNLNVTLDPFPPQVYHELAGERVDILYNEIIISSPIIAPCLDTTGDVWKFRSHLFTVKLSTAERLAVK